MVRLFNGFEMFHKSKSGALKIKIIINREKNPQFFFSFNFYFVVVLKNILLICENFAKEKHFI